MNDNERPLGNYQQLESLVKKLTQGDYFAAEATEALKEFTKTLVSVSDSGPLELVVYERVHTLPNMQDIRQLHFYLMWPDWPYPRPRRWEDLQRITQAYQNLDNLSTTPISLNIVNPRGPIEDYLQHAFPRDDIHLIGISPIN